MKTVLVTGGAGFIGQHLVHTLAEQGNRVYVTDNFSTSLLTAKDFINEWQSGVLYQVDDVADTKWMERWKSAHWLGEVQEIYHLACPASPLHYQKTPVETLRTAVVGTLNVLEIARTLRCKVVIASTSEIYGDPLEHPQKEHYLGNVSCVGPRACYDEGKRAGEAAAFAYREQHGVDVRIARIFNTYGPGMCPDDGRLLPNMIMQAIHNDPITIYGDGMQTRSFCYVTDTVAALRLIMGAGRKPPYVPVFNVGNPQERTIRDVAQAVLSMAGLKWDEDTSNSMETIGHLPLPKDDPTRRCPDITRIQQELGWTPTWQFQDGLRNTFEWFKGRA